MTSVLVLGDAEVQLLRALRELASKHPINVVGLMDKLKRRPAFARQYKAQMFKQSIVIPFQFCVTYSIETGHPAGTCRHMSMSSGVVGRMPSHAAVNMIAEELGFVGGHEACEVWIEDLDPSESGCDKAVNLAQPIAIAATEVAHA